MADNPNTPDPPTEPDPSYLSFSNPNYNVDGQAQSPTDEDDPLSFDQLSVTDGSAADKHIYANSDYSSAAMTPSSPDRSFILQKLNSPDEEDDTDDDTSSLEDDSEMTHNLLDSRDDIREESTYMTVSEEGGKKGRGILGYLAMLERQAKDGVIKPGRPDSPDDGLGAHTPDELDAGEILTSSSLVRHHKLEISTDLNSPDSQDSGIQPDSRIDRTHIRGPITKDIYAIVDKKALKIGIKTPDSPVKENKDLNEEEEEKEEKEAVQEQVLPPGWQKHEDEDGPYYWHIKSGTIQRDPPPPAPPDGPSLCTTGTVRSLSLTSDSSSQGASSIPTTPTSVTSTSERRLVEAESHPLQCDARSLHSLDSPTDQQPTDRQVAEEVKVKGQPARFCVSSMGCLDIAEEDLTPDRSSKAVNKCIMDLSLAQTDVVVNTVGRWGEGREIYMDIDCNSLRLIDPNDSSVLHSQPIHSIRVWGVGRDNGRDFAYVARDRTTRTHMCHVFHCEMPARQIANTLRDICKRIMQERGVHAALTEPRVSRPTDLPDLEKLNQQNAASVLTTTTFPTPMEEPRKVICCHYLGSHEVSKPTDMMNCMKSENKLFDCHTMVALQDDTCHKGMDMINEAVDWMYYQVPPEKWTFVDVGIAPSTITITEHENPDNILEECRVRFMSFMGISITSVKLCAFVMHTAQNKFVSHVFHCEPSAGPMCKTIEAACKLRYQKCLDAHPQTKSARHGKGVGAVLKAGVKAGVQGVQNILGLIKNKNSQGATNTKS